jgi:hypothetical protein
MEIRYKATEKFLHHNFVVTLLNDLFGIQARGGCMCAGPLGMRLLDISEPEYMAIEHELFDKHELLRPGFVRVSLGYYWSEPEVNYLIEGVKFVAEHGWKLLPAYTFYPETGEFKHKSIGNRSPYRRWLHNISYGTGRMVYQPMVTNHDHANDWELLLESANTIAEQCLQSAEAYASSGSVASQISADETAILSRTALDLGLRWFVLPSDVIRDLKGTLQIRLAKDVSSVTLRGEVRLLASYSGGAQNYVAAERVSVGEIAASNPGIESPCCANIGVEPEERLAATEQNAIGQDPSVLTPKQLKAKQERLLFPEPPKALTKLTGQAIGEYHMIREGDRVLLGLSGGKDSLTLLHVLHALQKRSPVKFELAAVTMNPNFPGFDPTPLIGYMKTLGIPYFFESQQLLPEANKCDPSSICSWCSRMKRKAMTHYLLPL